jgi:hypothetical protein
MYYFFLLAIFSGVLIWDIATAHAEYVPLIGAGFFDGVTADVMAGAGGWLGVAVAVAGAMLILKVLTR